MCKTAFADNLCWRIPASVCKYVSAQASVQAFLRKLMQGWCCLAPVLIVGCTLACLRLLVCCLLIFVVCFVFLCFVNCVCCLLLCLHCFIMVVNLFCLFVDAFHDDFDDDEDSYCLVCFICAVVYALMFCFFLGGCFPTCILMFMRKLQAQHIWAQVPGRPNTPATSTSKGQTEWMHGPFHSMEGPPAA